MSNKDIGFLCVFEFTFESIDERTNKCINKCKKINTKKKK